MISRIWHGWTSEADADTYEALLKTEIFPEIISREVAGFERVELFRRDFAGEVEFMTVMWFDSIDAVKEFAGEDYEKAYVPKKARGLLARCDALAQHYEVRHQRESEFAAGG